MQDGTRSGLEDLRSLEVAVASSDILSAGIPVSLFREGLAASLRSGTASKMSELARARRALTALSLTQPRAFGLLY